MAFCSKCGIKLADGEVFCGKCGTKINDESLITNITSEENNNENTKATLSNAKKITTQYATPIMDVFKSMLTKPISSANKFIDLLDKKTTAVLYIISAVIQGLFAIWSFKQIFLIVDKLFSSVSSNLIDLSIDDIGDAAEVPYGQIFIHGAISFFIIAIVLYLGIYFAFNVLSRANINSFDISKVIILSIIPVLGGELLCLLASYINVVLAILLLLISVLVFFSTLLISMKKLSDISIDSLVLSLSILFTIMSGLAIYATCRFFAADVTSLFNESFWD